MENKWKVTVLIRSLYDEYVIYKEQEKTNARSFRNFVKKDCNVVPAFERLKMSKALIDAFWKQMAEINANEFEYNWMERELKHLTKKQ